MSMTKEETIKQLESLYDYCENMRSGDNDFAVWERDCEAIKIALSALRGPTREQVEKTKAVFCQPCVGDFEQDTWRCSKCFVQEFGDVRGINFCPHCGAPMTEEAVETIMKRMEEMRNG